MSGKLCLPVVLLTLSLPWAPVAAAAQPPAQPLTIPSDVAVPPGSVDRMVPGFQVRTYLVEAGYLANTVERAEQELAGEWGANVADPAIFSADGYYLEAGVINYFDSGDSGYFDRDAPFPGVTGDNFALEAVAFIEFPKPGPYTLGVYCDDSFKLSVGKDFRDRFDKGMILGQADGPGGRSPTNSLFSVVIETAGIYPFRLVYGEGNYNNPDSTCEWFSVLVDGTKVLINDPSNSNALKAYAKGPYRGPAYLKQVDPGINRWKDSGQVDHITVVLADGDTKVIPGSVNISLDGTALDPAVTQIEANTTATATLSKLSPGSHTVQLSYDHTTTPISTRQISFTLGIKLSASDVPANSFWIEAEDFDYRGGKAMPSASRMPYAGGAYEGAVAAVGIDYYHEAPAGDDYRPRAVPGKNGTFIYLNPLSGLATERPGGQSAAVNYTVSFGFPGDWYNYTRDIPNGFYKILAALSFDGMDPDQLRGALDIVTDGLGTTNQTVQLLGTFDAPGSGGFGVSDLVPMKFASGQDAVYKLGGETTLRFEMNWADIDYFILAPVSQALPALAVSPSASEIQPEEAMWVINDLSTAVVPASIQLRLDGQDTTAEVTITKANDSTTIRPKMLLAPGSSHSWQLTFSDNGTPPNTQSFTGSFSIGDADELPPGPKISIARQGTSLVLSFEGKLFKADEAYGPYLEVPGATSPLIIPTTAAGRSYWRVEP